MLNLAAEEKLLLVVPDQYRTDRLGQTPLRHITPRDRCRLLNVARGARGHTISAEHDFLGGTSAVAHDQTCLELLPRDRYAVVLGQREREPEGAATRYDGHFVKGIVALDLDRADRVARLVISR